jgi:hypothetical protein
MDSSARDADKSSYEGMLDGSCNDDNNAGVSCSEEEEEEEESCKTSYRPMMLN